MLSDALFESALNEHQQPDARVRRLFGKVLENPFCFVDLLTHVRIPLKMAT
jgi:hypothetical protein